MCNSVVIDKHYSASNLKYEQNMNEKEIQNDESLIALKFIHDSSQF